MSKHAHRYHPFSITASFHLKALCAHVLTRPYPSDSIFVSHTGTMHGLQLQRFLLISSLPQHALLSPLSVTSFKLVVVVLITFLA
ncbi:unnamed protein product [Hymenolepis diminuta]|uniref:Uncharacterized protein n=1 Tax=Hymenolepis diminuta TaxID=6216 RepID=A0A564YWV7_HYMDI|nr:unnamed protein product [Hymenolepis diminuta]